VDIGRQHVSGISDALGNRSNQHRPASADFPAAPSIAHAASGKLSERAGVEKRGKRREALCCFRLSICQEVVSVGHYYSSVLQLNDSVNQVFDCASTGQTPLGQEQALVEPRVLLVTHYEFRNHAHVL